MQLKGEEANAWDSNKVNEVLENQWVRAESTAQVRSEKKAEIQAQKRETSVCLLKLQSTDKIVKSSRTALS